MKVNELITDELLEKVFCNANFGDVSKREVIANTLLKCASGYNSGHTAKCIVEELGLVNGNWKLTKFGQEYLYAAYSNSNL